MMIEVVLLVDESTDGIGAFVGVAVGLQGSKEEELPRLTFPKGFGW
jgi:hypothetical protein